jgi:hypothetical protein
LTRKPGGHGVLFARQEAFFQQRVRESAPTVGVGDAFKAGKRHPAPGALGAYQQVGVFFLQGRDQAGDVFCEREVVVGFPEMKHKGDRGVPGPPADGGRRSKANGVCPVGTPGGSAGKDRKNVGGIGWSGNGGVLDRRRGQSPEGEVFFVDPNGFPSAAAGKIT